MAAEPKVIDLASYPDHFYYQAPNSKHLFALNSENMIHLQLYLAMGKNLPAEGNEFEDKYPGSDISPYFHPPSLPNWYKDTKKNFINIHNYTIAFHDQTLPQIFIFTGKISNNAEMVQENLFNLGTHITKMTAAEPGITKKKEIVNCKAICKELKTDAKDMSKEVNILYTALYNFEQATSEERSQNKKLNAVLRTELPLMETAHKTLLGNIADFTAKAEKLDKEYIANCTAAYATPAFLLVPIFGLIAAATMAGIWGSKAVETKEKRDQILAELAATRTTEHGQYKAYLKLTELRKTTLEIGSIITEALLVLKDMELAFSNMATDCDSILSRITKIENGIDDADLWETTLSPQKIKLALEKWKKVQNAADDFRTVGPTKVTT